MHENKIKESLKIKPVSLKYLDQYNELLRYVFQVTGSWRRAAMRTGN